MSEPWANDFRALRDHTRQDAPSLERTKSFVLASAINPENPKEKNMSFVKRRPVLALAIALAFVALVTPVAYAVVNKVFLSIDVEQSEEEIARSVEEQLEAAGISGASVSAKKGDGRLEIGVASTDPDAELPNLDVSVIGGPSGANLDSVSLSLSVECDLSAEQQTALTALVTGKEFLTLFQAALLKTPAERAAELRAFLAARGYDATLIEEGSVLRIKVTGFRG